MGGGALMKGTTHLAAGILLAAVIPTPTLPTTVGIVTGSILPDIDKSSSMLGQHIPVLPLLLRHRGITHSLLFAGAMFLVNRGLGVGCLCHLLFDALNPSGVPLFWPFKKRIRIPILCNFCPSGGFADMLLGSTLWLLDILWIAQYLLAF